MSSAKKNCAIAYFVIQLLLVSLPQTSHAAKIISIAFFSSKSHKITYEPLLHELASRGHQVTVVSPVISTESIPNIRQVMTINVEEGMKNMLNFFEMRDRGDPISPFAMCMNRFEELCRRSYDLPNVQALLQEKFDLVLLQPIFNECAAGFVYKLNSSVVLVSPFGVPSTLASLFGSPSPPSFVPNMFSGQSDEMTFYERALNLYTELSYAYNQNFYFKPRMEAIYREKLNDSTIPSSDDIFRNASLILSNSHFSLNRPRPFLPDIVEVGGMHTRPAKPLTKDLEEFINTSGSDGFIYFSMGSALQGSMLPKKYRIAFCKAFGQIKQNVIWKWETETMPDLPKNVKLSKWLPQQDILGHPKIKAFITHGGLGGVTEAVYHGVPIIGIPIFGDQYQNMKQADTNGFAITLEFTQLSEESILGAINKIIKDSRYGENARRLSKIYKDQPQKSLDKAVFWAEYIMRHKGALHLRSSARHLNFFQFHSVDVIFVLFAVIGLIIFAVYLLTRRLILFLMIVLRKPKTLTKSVSRKKIN